MEDLDQSRHRLMGSCNSILNDQPTSISASPGLECYTHTHDEAATRFCLDWCDRHDLLITGGSDCHGGFVGREPGVPVVHTTDLRLERLAERYTAW